jgi:hypothetical protein
MIQNGDHRLPGAVAEIVPAAEVDVLEHHAGFGPQVGYFDRVPIQGARYSLAHHTWFNR